MARHPKSDGAPAAVQADGESSVEVRRSLPQILTRWPKYEEACLQRGVLPKFARAAVECLRDGELDLNAQGLGDLQLEALLCDDGLVPLDVILRWRLRDARLSSAGLSALSAKLPPNTEVLDLATNEIGTRGAEEVLAKLPANGRIPLLRHLDLSANGLRNDAVAALAGGLVDCTLLIRLDLHHNAISDGAALGKLIEGHTHLMRLSLHCNFLSGEGTAALFRGVLRNSKRGGRIADVDMAWNGIGDEKSSAAAACIAAVLRESTALYHLDLSYNSLDAAACAVIAEGLRDNHHLYGLHFVGNAATMDADGFLRPLGGDAAAGLCRPPGEGRSPPLSFGDPRNGAAGCLGDAGLRGRGGGAPAAAAAAGPEDTGAAAGRHGCAARRQLPWSEDEVLRERDVLEQRTPCWACEGWERVDLIWPVNPEKPEPKAVWAFTSLDGFRKGMRLLRSSDRGPPRFSGARMVPAGFQLLVVFQVDAGLFVAPDMELEALASPVDIELLACEELSELEPPPDQEVVLRHQAAGAKGAAEHRLVLRMGAAGVLRGASRASPPAPRDLVGRRVVLLDGPDGAGPVQMPRVTGPEFRMRTKRTRSRPFWSGFKQDSEAVMRDCFKLDWTRAKVDRIVEEKHQQAVQELIFSKYQGFLALYRDISATGANGAMGFGVQQIEASDAMAGAGLVDGVSTRLSDVDRLFIAARVPPADAAKELLAVRRDKALVRHQFLELILRLAHQRYVQTGAAANIVEAVGRVLDALTETMEARVADMNAFMAAMHTEEVDDVFKRHLGTLQSVYKKFSGRLTPPGLASFMSFSEFQELLELADMYDTEFTLRRSGLAFRMGMMTQAEENLSSRFQEMTLIEFQHALGAAVFLRADYVPGQLAALADDIFSRRFVRLAARSKRQQGKPP